MQAGTSYRKKVGIKDAKGKRHTIDAYMAIKSNFELRQAAWLLGAAGVGVQFPGSAMEQFNAGKPFTVVKGARIGGGHYMPAIDYDDKYVYLLTWGKMWPATWGWVTKYTDESIA